MGAGCFAAAALIFSRFTKNTSPQITLMTLISQINTNSVQTGNHDIIANSESRDCRITVRISVVCVICGKCRFYSPEAFF
jgi:hypothetical protein